jgi:SPP1 gp7 family putative phage head morphogenesis protein
VPHTAPQLLAIRARREILRKARGRRPPLRRPVPRQRPPNAIRLAYFRALRGLLRSAHALIETHLLPRLEHFVRMAGVRRGDSLRLDAADDEVRALVRRLAREFANGLIDADLERLVREYGLRTEAFEREQLSRQVRAAIGIDLPQADPLLADALRNFVSENVALIRTIPEQYFAQVEDVVAEGVNEGLLAGELSERIAERFGVAESRAQLIARDQIGKYYGALNEVRQADLGIDGYFWRTSNDNRVREQHEEREGKRFLWSDPPDGGHPGTPINCRCYAEPDLSGIVDALGQ